MGNMQYTVEKANQYISANKSLVNSQFKPVHHLTADVGWINDPNGFVYFRGEYHLFYQFYPYASQWGPMHWGHAKSKDLVNWEQLPVALAPDQDYDRNGCFSGSAIVKDDQLWLMYTGHIEEEDGVRQVQNMAVSDDGIHFTKIDENPVATGEILPDEVSFRDFRDPKVFEKNGHYYAVVASQHKDQVGCIVLLGSDDLVEWKFESIFLKGESDQGIIFECPDYFEIDGLEYLIVSPMRMQRTADSYHNINSSVFFRGKVDWNQKVFIPEEVVEIDHGQDFYAPQTLIDEKHRRIMVAWMQMWGRNIPSHELQHGWAGAMTLPRELKVLNGKLSQILLPETKQIMADVQIGDFVAGFSRLTFNVSDSCRFRLGNEDDYIEFGYDVSLKEVYIDRRHLKLDIRGEEELSITRRFVSVQAEKLDIIFDTHSIEIFVNDGEEVLTSTYYIAEQKKIERLE